MISIVNYVTYINVLFALEDDGDHDSSQRQKLLLLSAVSPQDVGEHGTLEKDPIELDLYCILHTSGFSVQ